jgi:hypothetical protein
MTAPAERGRYQRIIEGIFLDRYHVGDTHIDFARDDISAKAAELGIEVPLNLGDVVYNLRYRADLPEAIRTTAPAGMEWIIRSIGRARYRLVLVNPTPIEPDPMLAVIKVPDATPGVIERYRLSDEQALLAKVRYNRLLDIFTGLTCYSLQTHLRTTVGGIGQIETDEIYVGINQRGGQFVLPVQAKGGTDRMRSIQIEQDFAMCAEKFPELACRAIGAQFMADEVIALFEFQQGVDRTEIVEQRHYRLVTPDQISDADLRRYRGALPPPAGNTGPAA